MVIDTSVFIEFLRAKDKKSTILYQIVDEDYLSTTSITVFELLMGATDETKKQDIKRLTNDLIILPFTEQSAVEAGIIFHKLRRNNKLIEFRDIFIAAICITNNLPLLTANRKHFERIEGLSLLDF